MANSLIDFEFYETPQAATDVLFDSATFEDIRIDGKVFEPCVGSGAIQRAARRALPELMWLTNDLDPRWVAGWHQDAAEDALWQPLGLDKPFGQRQIDWVITNPPFTLAIPVLDRALRTVRHGVAMHLRISIHEPLKTGIRRTFMDKNRPAGVIFLPRFAYQRSAKTGTWTTDSVTCAWCIWLKNSQRQFIHYAPDYAIDALDKETDAYRERMDAIMGLTGTEKERQQQRIAMGS